VNGCVSGCVVRAVSSFERSCEREWDLRVVSGTVASGWDVGMSRCEWL